MMIKLKMRKGDKKMRKLVYISLLSFLVSSILLFTSQFTPAAQKTSDTLKVALILNQSDFQDLKIFDTTEIHVASIVMRMIEN